MLVQDDDSAYVFYFVHPAGVDPDGSPGRVSPFKYRQTVLQVARLGTSSDGKQLTCDRDAECDFALIDELGG